MSTETPTIPFQDHVRTVVRSLRGAFSQLIASVGANPRDAQSISSALGLNKNLAWKISKIVQADDPALVIQQMPGAAGLNIFLRGVKRAGASPELLDSARGAIGDFEQLIEVHSGDRATLEMMGSELSPNGRQQRDEYYRKLLYQGASYVWGVQARVSLKVGLVGPNGTPGFLDFASLNALIDFRRLRPDVTWTLASRRCRNDDGSEMETFPSEAIDPRHDGPDCAPLVEDFCSQPLPNLRRVVAAGSANFELVEGPVGNTGARTCVFGAIQRRIPYYRAPENEYGEHAAISDTPAELMIVDLYFHKDFTFAMQPEIGLYSELGAKAAYPAEGRDRNKLPLNEPLQDLGTGSLLLATPEVRQYSKMVQAMFDRMEWAPTDFHGFRMRIPYPACPTAFVLRYPLPEAP